MYVHALVILHGCQQLEFLLYMVVMKYYFYISRRWLGIQSNTYEWLANNFGVSIMQGAFEACVAECIDYSKCRL